MKKAKSKSVLWKIGKPVNFEFKQSLYMKRLLMLLLMESDVKNPVYNNHIKNSICEVVHFHVSTWQLKSIVCLQTLRVWLTCLYLGNKNCQMPSRWNVHGTIGCSFVMAV